MKQELHSKRLRSDQNVETAGFFKLQKLFIMKTLSQSLILFTLLFSLFACYSGFDTFEQETFLLEPSGKIGYRQIARQPATFQVQDPQNAASLTTCQWLPGVEFSPVVIQPYQNTGDYLLAGNWKSNNQPTDQLVIMRLSPSDGLEWNLILGCDYPMSLGAVQVDDGAGWTHFTGSVQYGPREYAWIAAALDAEGMLVFSRQYLFTGGVPTGTRLKTENGRVSAQLQVNGDAIQLAWKAENGDLLEADLPGFESMVFDRAGPTFALRERSSPVSILIRPPHGPAAEYASVL
jgi:hypothetical protein